VSTARARRAAAAGLAVAALVAGCSASDPGEDAATTTTVATAQTPTTITQATSPDDPLGGFQPAPIQWSSCGGDGTECATLTVPVDWSNPTGATIDLALARAPATGEGDSLGALVFNLGGPGATGVDAVPGGYIFPDDLRARFDIVSWDPRGIGQSAPLHCGDEVDPFVRLDSQPDTPQEQQALDDAARAVATECGQEDADLLPHMGTDDVARDLEAIRRSLGEPMSYIGFSYGTFIGERYAALFPTGARAIVLDGVVDPTDGLPDLLRGQAAAFERVIGDVFAGCPAGQEGCPDGGAAAAYDRIAAAVEQQPIPAGRSQLGPADLATGTILVAYAESLWPRLYTALDDADHGDGTGLLQLADLYHSLAAYPPYAAVSCLDSPHPEGGPAWAAFAAELEAISPRFGGPIANEMLPCAFWPVPPDDVTGPVRAEGSPPILVIGTTGDPATPIEQAQAVAAGLADGHLLVYDGEGHTAYGQSSCVDDAVAAYLLDGTLPADGTVCR
jgi:pimeloyl-ACP methyl ester carboxylesterase